jgi:peptidoglycan/LPS O-acetylase OafA/YrhL
MQGAIFGYPAISIAYGALVLAALSPTCILYRYPSRLMRRIATLSYAIYLTHKQLIHLTLGVLKTHGIGEDTYTAFGICIGVALLGGWLLHHTVERPFLHLRDRLLASRRSADPATPPA